MENQAAAYFGGEMIYACCQSKSGLTDGTHFVNFELDDLLGDGAFLGH